MRRKGTGSRAGSKYTLPQSREPTFLAKNIIVWICTGAPRNVVFESMSMYYECTCVYIYSCLVIYLFIYLLLYIIHSTYNIIIHHLQ